MNDNNEYNLLNLDSQLTLEFLVGLDRGMPCEFQQLDDLLKCVYARIFSKYPHKTIIEDWRSAYFKNLCVNSDVDSEKDFFSRLDKITSYKLKKLVLMRVCDLALAEKCQFICDMTREECLEYLIENHYEGEFTPHKKKFYGPMVHILSYKEGKDVKGVRSTKKITLSLHIFREESILLILSGRLSFQQLIDEDALDDSVLRDILISEPLVCLTLLGFMGQKEDSLIRASDAKCLRKRIDPAWLLRLLLAGIIGKGEGSALHLDTCMEMLPNSEVRLYFLTNVNFLWLVTKELIGENDKSLISFNNFMELSEDVQRELLFEEDTIRLIIEGVIGKEGDSLRILFSDFVQMDAKSMRETVLTLTEEVATERAAFYLYQTHTTIFPETTVEIQRNEESQEENIASSSAQVPKFPELSDKQGSRVNRSNTPPSGGAMPLSQAETATPEGEPFNPTGESAVQGVEAQPESVSEVPQTGTSSSIYDAEKTDYPDQTHTTIFPETTVEIQRNEESQEENIASSSTQDPELSDKQGSRVNRSNTPSSGGAMPLSQAETAMPEGEPFNPGETEVFFGSDADNAQTQPESVSEVSQHGTSSFICEERLVLLQEKVIDLLKGKIKTELNRFLSNYQAIIFKTSIAKEKILILKRFLNEEDNLFNSSADFHTLKLALWLLLEESFQIDNKADSALALKLKEFSDEVEEMIDLINSLELQLPQNIQNLSYYSPGV